MNRKILFPAIGCMFLLLLVLSLGCAGGPSGNVTPTQTTPPTTLPTSPPVTMSEQEQQCTQSGGNVTTMLCCTSAGDFPNLCLVGPCGCSPANSHEIKVCDCGTGKCFNGTACIAL